MQRVADRSCPQDHLPSLIRHIAPPSLVLHRGLGGRSLGAPGAHNLGAREAATMYVTMSVDIEAPPERVWPYLVEPDLCMQWFPMVKRYEWTSERSGVGSTFHWFERSGGREYSIDFKTTEWEPPYVFGFTMVSGDFFKSYDERWVIEAIDGGSRFTFNDRIEFPYGPLGSVIGWFAARQAKDTGTQALAELKRLAEAGD